MTNVIEAASKSQVSSFLKHDIWAGAKRWRLWSRMSRNELQQRYKRSWLGLGWIALSFILFTSVKVFIFGALSPGAISYYACFMAIGYAIFRLISSCVVAGSSIFVASQNWIKSEPLPLSVYLFKLLSTNFTTFAFAAAPTLVLCIWYKEYSWAAAFSFIPVMVIYAINGFWISALCGFLCARYRDLLHFITTAMQILYFVTPILWIPPETGQRATFAKINPVTHYVEIMRQPMLDGTIPWFSWQIVMAITCIGCLAALLVFAKKRSQLIYWL